MQKVNRLISVILLTMLVILSICKASDFLQLKSSDNRYASYFTEETQIDVLFLGSSHVRHGFFPSKLWNDYGITSYNLAGDGNTIPISYWSLVNALDYQTPKVVVMDVFDMWPGKICSPVWGPVHAALDAYPVSYNKYKMIKDLFRDKNMTDENGSSIYDKRWELLWDMGEYHTRWNSLSEEDFASQSDLRNNSRVWKGAGPLVEIVPRTERTYAQTADNLYYDTIAEDYLERMIALCKEKNITLLLINTGYDCDDESKYFADSVYEIAERHNLQYIDFTKEKIINFKTDLHTTGHNTHVNFSGAQKFTSFLGEVLSGQYQLTDYRNDKKYGKWHSDYQAYIKSKNDYLKEQEDIALYLLLLYDEDYNIIIEVQDSSILTENNNADMLENLGIDISKCPEGSPVTIIKASGGTVSYYTKNSESDYEYDTTLGKISACHNDDSTYGLYLKGKELYKAESGGEEKIRFTVINEKTKETADVKTF